MKHKFNYLSLLSLLSLVAVLGLFTENKGLLGFLGFLYYLRYIRIMPDELFILELQKAASFAFMAEMLVLLPAMFACHLLCSPASAVPTAFATSFVAAALSFTAALMYQEHKELTGAENGQ